VTAVTNSSSTIKDFKDLEVWKAARELRREIYRLAKALPDLERFELASQLRRAAVSVTANIAERIWTVRLPGERADVPTGSGFFIRVEGSSDHLCGRGIP